MAIVISLAFFISPAFRDRILRKKVDDILTEISREMSENEMPGQPAGSGPDSPNPFLYMDQDAKVLDEKTLNLFIRDHYQRDIPPEITDWAVELQDDNGTLYLIVDLKDFMGSIEEETSQAIADNVKKGIGFVIKGKLTGKDGLGIFKVEKVKLGIIPLPLGLISRVVKKEVRKQGETPLEDVFSLAFELPDGFQSVSIQDGRVVLLK